jgi:acetyltransferase-like isoleucine patch superfamily enzyme
VTRTVASYGGRVRVNYRTYLTPQTHLGSNVHFNGLRVNGVGRLDIGDNFHSGPECLIVTSIHDYDTDDEIPYGSNNIERPVEIGDNVWLGARVTIIGSVRIGEGAIVQAGAVVVSDIPAFAIVGGNPATVFKSRDIEHYRRLKEQGRFH